MGIERFGRVPLLFGPSPVHRLERLSEHSAARSRSGRSARTATRASPTAATRCASSSTSPRRRSRRAATRSSRSAACSRTTRARSRPSPRTRARAACSCRSTGSTGRTPSTTRSGTSCSRGSWAPTSGSSGRVRHRHPAELGGRARVGRGARRQAVRDPGRRLRPPARRARLRPLGRRGGRPGAGARRVLRHDRRLLGDRLDAGRHGRGLRRAGPAARVLGIDGSATVAADVGADRPHRTRTAEAIGLGRELATTRSSSSTSGTRARTAYPTRRRSRRSACARASRGCSPIPSTRASRWPR